MSIPTPKAHGSQRPTGLRRTSSAGPDHAPKLRKYSKSGSPSPLKMPRPVTAQAKMTVNMPPQHEARTRSPVDPILPVAEHLGVSSALEVPSTLPPVSNSRSLTTLIRDLHAEFSDLDEILNDDCWTSPLPSDTDKSQDLSTDSLKAIESAVTAADFASLLDELEIVATAVQSLPVPRPPSLSLAEWERALDSPDSRTSCYFSCDEEVVPHIPESRSVIEEEVLQDVTLGPEAFPTRQSRPLLPRRAATVDMGLSQPASAIDISVEDLAVSQSLQPQQGQVEFPTKSRSFKDRLSLKRMTSPSDPRIPPSVVTGTRSRGLSFPSINPRWKATSAETLAQSHPLPEPVSFLVF